MSAMQVDMVRTNLMRTLSAGVSRYALASARLRPVCGIWGNQGGGEGGLCYSSGSSWQEGISVSAYDAKGARIHWVQEPEDRADRGV